MPYCVKCGAELASGTQFCPRCGTPVQPPGAAAPGRPVGEKAEKAEKGEKKEKREKQARKGDLTGAFFGGGVLVWLGATFYLAQIGQIPGDRWWGYFLGGLGVGLILLSAARTVSKTHPRGAVGPLIGGIILLIIGYSAIMGVRDLWPLILVGVGIAIIIGAVTSRRRNPSP